MDIQFILVIIIFSAALLYVGRTIYRSILPKSNGCSSGCGKCAANFDNISSQKQ